MLKNLENKETEEIVLVTPTPGMINLNLPKLLLKFPELGS